MLEFKPHPSLTDGYFVYYKPNGVFLGHIHKDVDGYFYFWPDLKGGSWDGHVLRGIANKLSELNAEWVKIMDKEFSSGQM